MSTSNKRTQDMSVEEIFKYIRGIISRQENESHENKDILELTDVIDVNSKSRINPEGHKEHDYWVYEAANESAADSFKQFA